MAKKIFFTILALVLFFTAFYIRTITARPDDPPSAAGITPSPTPLSESSLYFSPDKLYAEVGQSYKSGIMLYTTGRYPSLLQLELSYDPSVISQISITPGKILPDPDILLNNTDPNLGRISFALALPSDKKPANHSGTAAQIQFRVVKSAPQNTTSINFLPKTVIRSKDSIIPLKTARGLKININPPVPIASKSSIIR